jgi:hypothetical protein
MGKRIIAVMLSFAMAIIGFTPLRAYAAGEETGNWQDSGIPDIAWYVQTLNADPTAITFTISDADDLAGLAALVNNSTVYYDSGYKVVSSGAYSVSGTDFYGKTIILTADINLTGHDWIPIGWYDSANSNIYPFDGTLNGGQHKITGMSINTSTLRESGLLGVIWSSAEIKDLIVKNMNVVSSFLNNADAGGIVGYSYGGTIDNCSVSGTVTVSGTHASAGGVVGYCETAAQDDPAPDLNGCVIKDSVSGCTVNGGDTSIVGGFVGTCVSPILNCWSTGTVTGGNATPDATDMGYASYTGGFVGYAQSYILNCFATGNVFGGAGVSSHKALIGGFSGKNYGAVSNCYATGNVTGGALATLGGFTGGNNNGILTNTYWNISADQKVNASAQSLFNGESTTDTNGLTEDVMKGAAPVAAIIYTDDSGSAATGTDAGAFLVALNGGIGALTSYLPTGETAVAWKADGGTPSVQVNKGYPLLFNVSTGTAPTITTNALNDGTVGTFYSNVLAATGDTPITWMIDTGSLPDGLSLSGDTISGTPTAAGTTNFTVKAENSTGIDAKALSIEINPVSTDKILVSITAPAAITGLTNGTAKTASALGLPGTVTLVTSGGNVSASVSWDLASSSYNVSSGSAQTFTVNGTVTLPAGVINLNNVPLSTSINVTVNAGSNGGSFSGDTPSTPSTPDYKADVDVGGGPATTLPVTVDNGNASVDVGAGSGLMSGGKSTVISVPTVPDVDTYTLGIPVPSLSTTGVQGTLIFNTDIGNVTVPSNMLTGVEGISGSKAQISIGQGDKSNLSADIKAAIGDRPLIQLTLSIDGKQTDWSNPNAAVTVSIPYTPTADELKNPESIVIWYIDGSGNVVTIPNGHYDPATGMVTFDTTHFSDYAVAYNKVSFNDVAAGAWYNKAVSFIAARGITGGTGNGNYSPDAKLTRGEFLVMLMKAYVIAPDANSTDNFSDAGNTYYTGYLAAAKRLGITTGVGNNQYAPGKEITRQEMFTLLYNALKVIGQLPQGDSGNTLSDFTDAGQIDTWAKDAMTLMVETGTVSGNNGALTPLSTATRAEMAQVLYNLLKK